jgi:hypothetical protein
MHIHRYLIISLALLIALAPSVAQAQAPDSWTILIYLDGDNNLEREAIDDFLEMSTVGSNADVNIVVQFDRIAGYDTRYGDWTGTMRFLVTQGMTPEPGNALADLGEANMGDPQTLIDFVTWGQAAFPAQRTAVIVWNHGDGWRAADFLKRRRKAIAWDDTDGHDALDLAELRDALVTVTGSGASPVDLLAFDACLMAMIEIDAQILPYVRVRVASEETEPGTGYPFDDILADLQDNPQWDAPELGVSIVEHYYQTYEGETQSAMDLGEAYGSLIAAVDTLSGALIAHYADHLSVLQAVRRDTQQFQVHYVDLADLAGRLAEAFDVPEVQQAAQAVADAVPEVTLAERHGSYWPGANGMTIYFPAQPSGWDSKYDGKNDYLVFTAETRWDEFLVAYLELANVCDPDVHEPDGDPASATPIEVGGKPQQHSFCPETDTADWVSFQAQGGQSYEIATLELEPYCDTVIKLYDTDGQTLIAQDDDGGAGFASRIEWTSPISGTYYVEVIEYFGRTGPDTGYALRVDRVAPSCQIDAFEPDGDPASATAIDVDGPAQAHNFCAQDDTADWASFEAMQGETYAVETSDLGIEANTALALFDTDGATLLMDDDDGGTEPLASRIQWTCPVSGTYFVRVRDADAHTGAYTDYQLRVSTVPFTVYGTVHLQGRNAFGGTQVTAQPISHTVTTDTSGTFGLTATVPCTITARHPGYLLHEWTVTETVGISLTLEIITLLGGDINGDREVDILDIAYIGARFGTGDALADLNGDGIVDILDIVMAASNFKKRV